MAPGTKQSWQGEPASDDTGSGTDLAVRARHQRKTTANGAHAKEELERDSGHGEVTEGRLRLRHVDTGSIAARMRRTLAPAGGQRSRGTGRTAGRSERAGA
jgi:hypothetical protein